MDKQILNAIKHLERRVVDLYKKIKSISLIPGPTGPQGIQGTNGVAGPIGPAGLIWQGAWTSGVSYVKDNAVGYGGASYFCILATNGTATPNTDTTHWALLASQGANGIQGVQGPTGAQGATGTVPVKTKGQLYGSSTTYQDQTLLSYDINLIDIGSVSNFFKLPNTTIIGKEVIVDVMGNNCQIYGFNGGLAFETSVNSSISQILAKFNDLIKFISIGGNFWIVEYLDRVPLAVPKITLKQNVLSLTQAQVLAMNTTPFIILTSNTPGVVKIPKDIIIKRVGTSGTPYTIPGGNQMQITFNNDTESISNLTLWTTPFTESTGVAFGNINSVYTQSATTNFLEALAYRLNVYGGMNPSGGTGNFLVYITYEEITL